MVIEIIFKNWVPCSVFVRKIVKSVKYIINIANRTHGWRKDFHLPSYGRVTYTLKLKNTQLLLSVF